MSYKVIVVSDASKLEESLNAGHGKLIHVLDAGHGLTAVFEDGSATAESKPALLQSGLIGAIAAQKLQSQEMFQQQQVQAANPSIEQIMQQAREREAKKT